ncbi:hypothetical protein [Saccharothrix variisporea]|uniref:AAA domain-containing protein n=1 Tax=Saccharothrix variisporea TaxID=543527 RepID=A0A495X5F2_9PSEU|nr:hypothetical protein [Saccharothrix variisporea]RKT68334.1 hypothetical protein DFJ66_1517 [Saccharothrix variisporea]
MTADLVPELRKWLASLNDADFSALLAVCDPLRVAAQMPPPGRNTRAPVRREILAARAHLARAPSSHLVDLAIGALSFGTRVLLAQGRFERSTIADPGLDDLRAMLTSLGKQFGRLVLFGLLLGNAQATPLATRWRSELEAALVTAPRTSPLIGHVLLDRNSNPVHSTRESMEAGTVDDTTTRPRAGEVPRGDESDELSARLDEVRAFAVDTAALLRRAADAVEAGSAPPEGVDIALERFHERRQDLLDTISAVVEIPPDADFAALSSLVAETIAARRRAREERAARQEAESAQASRRVRLEEQLAAVEAMLGADHGVAFEALRSARDELLAALGALEPTTDRAGTGDAEAPTAEPLAEPPLAEPPLAESPVAESPVAESPPVSTPSPQPPIGPVDSAPSEAGSARETAAPPVDDSPPPGAPPVPLPDEAERVEVNDMALGFPWEEGDPPLAVELASAGRLVEAYWVTAVSGEPDRRTATLRFAAMAFAVTNNADATAVLAGLELDVQDLTGDPDATALATTAALRAGLLAGWGHSVLTGLRNGLVLPARWGALIDTAIDAVRRGFRVDDGTGVLLTDSRSDETRAELGRRARNLAEELPRRKNPYQRATRVLQRLMLPNQPLCTALDAVVRWSEGGDGRAIATVLDRLTAHDAVETMIEAADAAMRTPKQARERIVASALRTLVRAIEEVREVVREADVVSRRLTAAESDDHSLAAQLSRALADVEGEEPPPGMVGVAMSLFRRWLQRPTDAVRGAPVVEGDTTSAVIEPSPDVLLILPDLPRDATGRPDPDDPRTSVVLADLVRPLDVGGAVSSYCERGDLLRARRVVELAAVGTWGDVEVEPLRQVLDRATTTWAKRHRSDLERARDLFARIRTQNLLDPADETTVAGRLEALTTVDDGAFDVAESALARLAEDLAAKQGSRVDELRAEIAALDVDAAGRDRMLALLDDGDTVTAAEFLAFVRAGKTLPDQVTDAPDDLKAFADLVAVGVARSGPAHRDSAQAWAELAAGGATLTPLATVGIDAWDSLKVPRGLTGDRLANSVRDILRVLGLQAPSRPQEIGRGARQGFRRFRVQGTPTDGSYVSTLGSAANEYNVVVITEERRGRRSVLDVLGTEDTGRANVLLYLYALDLPARRALAAEADRGSVQALVVDPAVVGWIAANAPGSWRATQRVTLPWTALNPYTPFVAGLVPPEVFVGRDREMAEVVDPNGGLFIYGGRQLGKSALLRRVEATFNDGGLRHAVYLDLKGKGIGEAEPASRIWPELVVELKKRSVLPESMSQDPPPDVVVNHVKAWLNHNSNRRLLLLADEADAFLTADSRGVKSEGGGVAHFPNVLRLKELMESTERRFKIVFAGLHQVQRFGHLSNVPLVHGGPDILVGPLDPADARRLVVAPLAALGYRFERPELVWRLLSATNYQASLIQIFCQELVRTLHDRVAQSLELPVPIREADVEAVAASDHVRARIAERLRITINLEDRYRVLTLVIAVLSLNDMFGADYGPEELLEEARRHWAAGFDDLTVSQVRIYLDEMVGLGLLIRLSGQARYAVRSPNVVNMLGTKADLLRELAETDFDLPYEYNPRDARRLLGTDPFKRRSPLTDGQLFELTAAGATSVVTGTVALGTDRVADAIKDYAELRGSKVEVHTSAADIAKAITNAARRKKATVLVADLRRMPFTDVKQVVDRLLKEKPACAVLVEPEVATQVAALAGVEVVRPARWTSSSLRSWPECPFDVVQARVRLIAATGGWIELVEEVIANVEVRGATQAQALDRVLKVQADPRWAAAFLDRTELPAAALARIGQWAAYVDPGEPLSPADVAAALELDLAATGEFLDGLARFGVLDETADGVALDVVVHRCTTAVHDRA